MRKSNCAPFSQKGNDMTTILNDPNFFYGAAVMGIFMLLLMIYGSYMRLQSLYLTAKHKGCEKIGDKFYYIVEESEYNALVLSNQTAFCDSGE